jgi:hypothetical protein
MKSDTSKTTMLTISMGFLIVHLVSSWQWAIIVALAVGIIGILSDTLSARIEIVWMKLAKFLSYVIPTILLGIVFYCVLLPFSLMSKLFVKDPLMLSGDYPSYFVPANREMQKQDFEKPW